MNLFGIWPLAGNEKTRLQPGQFKESSMESALVTRIYTPPARLSTCGPRVHLTRKIPITRLEFQKIYLRFQLGRVTGEDLLRYRYVEGWDAGQFYDANNFELGEELF